MERKLRSLRVTTDTGQEVVVYEYQEFIDGRTADSSGEVWLPGPKRLQLPDGGAVNIIDENTFQVVSTGQILNSG